MVKLLVVSMKAHTISVLWWNKIWHRLGHSGNTTILKAKICFLDIQNNVAPKRLDRFQISFYQIMDFEWVIVRNITSYRVAFCKLLATNVPIFRTSSIATYILVITVLYPIKNSAILWKEHWNRRSCLSKKSGLHVGKNLIINETKSKYSVKSRQLIGYNCNLLLYR